MAGEYSLGRELGRGGIGGGLPHPRCAARSRRRHSGPPGRPRPHPCGVRAVCAKGLARASVARSCAAENPASRDSKITARELYRAMRGKPRVGVTCITSDSNFTAPYVCAGQLDTRAEIVAVTRDRGLQLCNTAGGHWRGLGQRSASRQHEHHQARRPATSPDVERSGATLRAMHEYEIPGNI